MKQVLDIKRASTELVDSKRCLILIDHEALPCKQFGRLEMIPEDNIIDDL